MTSLVSVIHIATCLLLVLVVLIQQGKGAEISASFGGSSQTVFGSSGGANFFVKFTSTLAAIFMVTSIVLTIMGGQTRKSIFEGAPISAAPKTVPAPGGSVPAAPPAAGAPAAPNGAAPAAPANPAGTSALPPPKAVQKGVDGDATESK